jgi:hypothetical protein
VPPAAPGEMSALVRRLFWIAGVALLGIAATFAVVDAARARTERWMLHSREVARLARFAQTLATEREASVQSYLLIGDVARSTRIYSKTAR